MMTSIHFSYFFMDNEQDSYLDQVESSTSFRTLSAGSSFQTSKGSWTLQEDLHVQLEQRTSGVTAFAESLPFSIGCAPTADEAIADLIQAFVDRHDSEGLPELTAAEQKIREGIEVLFCFEKTETSGDGSPPSDTDCSSMT